MASLSLCLGSLSLFPSSSSPDALLGYFPVYLLEEAPTLSLNYSPSSRNSFLAYRGGEQAFEVGYGRRFRDLRIAPCAAVPLLERELCWP